MRISTVILPHERWREARGKWLRAQDLGFHAAYTYDHLSWRSFRERPWFEAMATLAAAAVATTTIRLGPLVTSPNFRHPVLLAKELLTLDDLSEADSWWGSGPVAPASIPMRWVIQHGPRLNGRAASSSSRRRSTDC